MNRLNRITRSLAAVTLLSLNVFRPLIENTFRKIRRHSSLAYLMILGAALGASGEAQADINVTESPAPLGYWSLGSRSHPVQPFALPDDCDNGRLFLDVPEFGFNGNRYSSVIWSVNGTLELGTASGLASAAANVQLPDSTLPNNLLAPLWTDLNLCDGGNWYFVVQSIDVSDDRADDYLLFEWENVPLFGDPSAYSFQVWIGIRTGYVYFTYGRIDSTSIAMTVGAENETGTDGHSYYYVGGVTPEGTPPAVGVDLKVLAAVTDSDGDGVADDQDNCPDNPNPLQDDLDLDGLGDVCDLDDDADTIADLDDNCPIDFNPGQADADVDGLGDACDSTFNTGTVVDAVEGNATDAVMQVLIANPPGGNGMIAKLTGNGGVVKKLSSAVAARDAGLLDTATFIDQLNSALEQLTAFDKMLAGKISNGQIVEPEASNLQALSAEMRNTINTLIANA